MTDEEPPDVKSHRQNGAYHHQSPRPRSPPKPQFQTLLPGEQLDFAGFQQSVDSLQDQCKRLMGSLEDARQTIKTLAEERDYYRDFWIATNNYQSVMSKFNIQTPFQPSPSPYPPMLQSTSTSSLPVFSHSQYNASSNQFKPLAILPQKLYTTSNSSFASAFSADNLQNQPLQPLHEHSEPAASSSTLVMTTESTHQTPPKRDSTRAIDSFFTSVKKMNVTPSNPDVSITQKTSESSSIITLTEETRNTSNIHQ